MGACPASSLEYLEAAALDSQEETDGIFPCLHPPRFRT
jgi:hypothetical protein